jgi:hypothetical protein
MAVLSLIGTIHPKDESEIRPHYTATSIEITGTYALAASSKTKEKHAL